MAKNRFTIFDMMEAKGFFAKNPANLGAVTEDGQPLYLGPQTYPKMMYHPTGEERITRSAEAQVTPFGPRLCNEGREMIYQVVNNKGEEKALALEGWWDHPAKAIQAGIDAGTRTGKAPPISSASRIADLEAKIAEMEEEKLRTEGAMMASQGAKAPRKPSFQSPELQSSSPPPSLSTLPQA